MAVALEVFDVLGLPPKLDMQDRFEILCMAADNIGCSGNRRCTVLQMGSLCSA